MDKYEVTVDGVFKDVENPITLVDKVYNARYVIELNEYWSIDDDSLFVSVTVSTTTSSEQDAVENGREIFISLAKDFKLDYSISDVEADVK